jgi:cellulose synthase/poly-beta-1,6-N-acetylglucosamine synthase-like glycosyltransferase
MYRLIIDCSIILYIRSDYSTIDGSAPMRVLLGIAAHNEEKNIRGVLSAVTKESHVDEVLVVSSSTDNTNKIVGEFTRRSPRVTLLIEATRRGKSSACNTIIEYAEKHGFDIVVYLGADNLPLKGSIAALLSEFESENVGVVGGKPEPIDHAESFLGWATHLQWNMHHMLSCNYEPKISGELMAFRANVVKEIPVAIINDDAYIQLLGEAKGYVSKYVMFARAKLKGCSSVKDFVLQRRRVYLGHLQALFMTGRKLSTFSWKHYPRVLKDSLPSFGSKQLFYFLGAVILQGWAYLLALADFHLFRLPYKWEIAQTTKTSIVEQMEEEPCLPPQIPSITSPFTEEPLLRA